MQLFKLLEKINYELVQGTDINIDGITIDSKKIKDNFLFVCIKGIHFNSHLISNEAILLGAKALLVDEDIQIKNKNITIIKVDNTRKALAYLAGVFFDEPYKKLKMIGVTGTNGKTSSTYFMEKILEVNNETVGVIGTVGANVSGKPIDIPFATSTTPDTIELMQILDIMQKSASAVVMEVSSHALALHKTDAIYFDVAIFTNLTQDHLDYHKTFENYFEAKSKLFSQCRFGAINIDDFYGKKIIEKASCQIITFGIINHADVMAVNVEHFMTHVKFDVKYKDSLYPFIINVPGSFTIYNALGVISASLSLNIPMEIIQRGLSVVEGIPGRIQPVQNEKGYTIIVDYAHSPDGLENIISAVREFTPNKVITIFGCGGDRDSAKRSIMGEISGRLSDYTIITSDNPRSEDPEKIISEIESGLLKESGRYKKIVDRKDAIFHAIKIANKGDSVIIAGKGHEDYQIFSDRTIHFNDMEIAKQALEEI